MASEKIMDVYSGEINVTIKPDGSPEHRQTCSLLKLLRRT